MLNLVPNDTQRYSLSETIHAEVSRYLYEAFTADDGLLSNVDRWTQRRVTVENLTKARTPPRRRSHPWPMSPVFPAN